MRSPQKKRMFPLSGVVCSVIGHNYIKTHKITDHIYEYRCTRCGKEMTNNYSGKMEVLTVKNRKINASLEGFYKKKMQRKVAVS